MPYNFMWLIMAVLAALVVAVGLVVRSKTKGEDADVRWQQFLFLTLAVLLILMLLLSNSPFPPSFLLCASAIGTLATYLLSLTDLHSWSSQRKKMTLLYTLGIGILVVILSLALDCSIASVDITRRRMRPTSVSSVV